MKKIVCEMCSSNDVIKDGDFYVCQACGTKYTVESARSLLKDIGTIDIKGKVEIDSANQVESLMAMLNNAIEQGSNKDALEYIEKILAIDPQNYQALYLKGKMYANRNDINEMYKCFTYALQNVPTEKEKELIVNIQNNIIKTYNNIVKDTIYELKNKTNYYDDYYGGISDRTFIKNIEKIEKNFAIASLNEKIIIDRKSIKNKLFNQTYDICYKDGEKNINEIKKLCTMKENRWGFKHPSYLPKKIIMHYYIFLEKIAKSATEIKLSLNACNLYIEYYNRLKDVGYYELYDDDTKKRWERIFNKEELSKLTKTVIQIERKQKEIIKEIARQKQEKIEKYWQEHLEEKKALDDKKESLENELNKILPNCNKKRLEIDNVKLGKTKMPAQNIVDSIEENINNLKIERNKLGLFKGKEKKEIDTKIEELKIELTKAKNTLESQKNELIAELNEEYLPIYQKVEEIKKEIEKIIMELTKER